MLVLGMMSGTSLDGVDAALIDTDGRSIAGFGRSAYRAYRANEAAVLHGALGRWPGEDGVADAAALSVAAHAALARSFPEAEAIGYHGQTLAHDPHGRGTHQAGCGARLAQATGRPVVWDFRTEDVRRGGEGAPLAPFFHHACARWAVAAGRLAAAPVAFLNLGGVGNITWTDPRIAMPEAPGACLAFDTGPANAPLNDLMRARRGTARDEGGALALAGQADGAVVAAALAHPFFDRRPPKSLDRDAFAAVDVAHLSDADAAASLVAIAAGAVARGLAFVPTIPAQVLVCGGGRRNAALMAALAQALRVPVAPVEAAGLDGDMLEAQAFGWLAARVLAGLPTSGPDTTGVPGPCCGGRVSWGAGCGKTVPFTRRVVAVSPVAKLPESLGLPAVIPVLATDIALREGYVPVPAGNLVPDKLKGVAVMAPGEEVIGKIDSLVLDQNGTISQIIIGVGGFLGLGEHEIAYPFDQLSFQHKADGSDLRGYVGTPAAEVKSLPEYHTP